MDVKDIELEASELSGYDTMDRFFASRYRQGGRTVYNIDLSLPQLAGYLTRPDPNKPTEDNRRIRPAHADSFAKYIRQRKEWVAPALLLRVPPDVLSFEPKVTIEGVEWGYLSVPRLARTELHIIDGQHRILGIHMAMEQLASDLEAARKHLAAAKNTGEPPLIKEAEAKIRAIQEEKKRLAQERISLQVTVIQDPKEYRQVFVDIADNALGITNAVKARFDSRKVVNRCLPAVLEHPLLRGNVDMEKDRVLGANPNLVGAKHVTDVIRTLEVGIHGRISARGENELKESHLVNQTNAYLDLLMGAFPDLAGIAQGSVTAPELRERSLLASSVMLRVFAGVYHEFVKVRGRKPVEVSTFFGRLGPFLGAPITEDSPWMATGLFHEGAMAPSARRQDLKALVDAIVGWAEEPPAWIKAA